MAPRPNDTLIKQAIEAAGGFRPAARLLSQQGFGISEAAIRRFVGRVEEASKELELELPGGKQSSNIDVDDLISRRIKEFNVKKGNYDREKLLPVRVRMDGPIGLGLMGDPHVDDDGTDLEQLFDHVGLFDGSNEGLYAGCIGDVANNWVGGLARLWSEQSTSAEESRAIVSEFLTRVNWMFYIHGNHDMWNNGNNLINSILSHNALIRKDTRVRLQLRLPNGRDVRLYAVHGFPGKSMWSEVYGAAKKAQLDGTHHIYAAGHIHTSGYAHGWHEGNELMWHAVQIASYKKIDRYAEELNLDPKDLYNCPVALIDPYASSQINFIRWEFDPHEGAERLAWMRKRFKESKSAS